MVNTPLQMFLMMPAGIAPAPNGLWMRQVARNLIDDLSGFLRRKRFLTHDRGPLYTRGFQNSPQGAVARRERLVDILSHYYREAA